jgi:hypothetical protein
MSREFSFGAFVAVASIWVAMAPAQESKDKVPDPVHLDISVEVAASTDDGTPSVLRVTLTNAGDVAADIPMPELDCAAGGGQIEIHLDWFPENSGGLLGTGSGFGCGRSDMPSLTTRVHNEWIRLQPGEFIVMSQSIRARLANLDPGTVEYWAEYIPPEVTAADLAELRRAGYNAPREKVRTAHETFAVQ